MGGRLKGAAPGVKAAITVLAIAATVSGWGLLASRDPAVPSPAPTVAPDSPAEPPLPPLPELVSVDVRPLPPPPPRPRVDVRTRASRRVR